MIKPDDIPKEVVEALAKAYFEGDGPKELAAAVLNTWPDALDSDRISFDGKVQRFMSLPLKARIIQFGELQKDMGK